MSNSTDWSKPAISPIRAGIGACCPRCGEGRLYAGTLTPATSCTACQLDYSFIDSGDGPAVFVIMILGFVILGLALIFQYTFYPPLWLHLILWPPVITLASIWGLRLTKALMIAYQYKTRASQAVLSQIDEGR